MEQLTIFDFLKEPIKEQAEIVADRMNRECGTNFQEIMNTGYYLLYVFVTGKHRLVIDGTGGKLGFGIDGFFLSANGFDEVKKRYEE